jgi:hypothetical protein
MSRRERIEGHGGSGGTIGGMTAGVPRHQGSKPLGFTKDFPIS